jgi:hypothetical protein
LGLLLGLILRLCWDAALEGLTGDVVRRGFGTDLRNALCKAFFGAAVGLVGGRLLGTYVARRR